MKKSVLLVLSLLFMFSSVSLVFAEKGAQGKFDAKVGDSIYVCGCGESCECGTLGMKEGNCGCGQKMVKTTVTKIEKGKIYYAVDGKELSAPAKGKYGCGCGDGCDCGYVSNKPGKCGCDKDMVKVKKEKKSTKK
jgi:hypothetical protein